MMEHQTLDQMLQEVLNKANGRPMAMREIFDLLKHRGIAIFIIIFSAPFLFPYQIPGLSVFFGFVILYLGLQIAFPKRDILPQRLLNKKINYQELDKWIKRTQWILKKVNRFVFHRFKSLVHKEWIYCFNGWIISVLSLVLILPIPIPLTNFVVALPIFLIGLGLTEEDGLFILFGYAASILGILGFITLVYFGYEEAEKLLPLFFGEF